jgi:hypothetical protein
MTPENWPEPVAFRWQMSDQCPPGVWQLSAAPHRNAANKEPLYTATQVHEIVRMEVESSVAALEKQIMYALTWARHDDLRAAIERVDFCGQMVSVRLSLLVHLVAAIGPEAQEKLKATYGNAPIRPEIQPWFDSAAILKAAVSSRKENKDAD